MIRVSGSGLVAVRRSTWKHLLTLAVWLATLPGCVGLSRPYPLSRRAPHFVQHHAPTQSLSRRRLARMCRQSGEPYATAKANEPKELNAFPK